MSLLTVLVDYYFLSAAVGNIYLKYMVRNSRTYELVVLKLGKTYDDEGKLLLERGIFYTLNPEQKKGVDDFTHYVMQSIISRSYESQKCVVT